MLSPQKGSANRTYGRRRKNERKEDGKAYDSKVRDPSAYLAAPVLGSQKLVRGPGTRGEEMGQLGAEGNVSQFAQSQEYSFARTPNTGQLEGGVTARRDEDRRHHEMYSQENLFTTESREEPESQGEHQNQAEPSFPMSSEDFILIFKTLMLSEEIQELE